MQPSGLAPLPDRSRNKILREIFHSLCWRPQTSPARVDSSNPEERFNICWTSLTILKKSFQFGWGHFSLLRKTPPAFWAEQIFLLEILFFFLLFWIAARKFSGLGTQFFPEHRRQTKSQITAWRLSHRTQGQIRRKEPFAANEGQEGISDQSRHESCHVTFLGWQMKYFNLSCHLYLDARLYSEVLLYMDIKWCGWPGLKQKVWFHVCLHAGTVSFYDSRFPQRRIWSSDIVEGWWQRQRNRFNALFMLSSWVRTHMKLMILGKHNVQFSRFPEGDLLLMRVLIGRTIALIAWKLCMNVSPW